MRKTLGVCLLILLLTGSASAGIIPNESPAPPAATQEQTADGIIQGGLTETVLSVLESVLALF